MTKLGDLLAAQGANPSAGTFPEHSNSALPGLAALMQRPEARGLYYNRKKVKLDGYKFAWCRFDACHLIVESTNFQFDHCIIDSETHIEWYGEIVKVLQLFNSRYEWAYTAFPGFAPTRHQDGTISITTPSE